MSHVTVSLTTRQNSSRGSSENSFCRHGCRAGIRLHKRNLILIRFCHGWYVSSIYIRHGKWCKRRKILWCDVWNVPVTTCRKSSMSKSFILFLAVHSVAMIDMWRTIGRGQTRGSVTFLLFCSSKRYGKKAARAKMALMQWLTYAGNRNMANLLIILLS